MARVALFQNVAALGEPLVQKVGRIVDASTIVTF